jgi:nucleoid-associated protein YgaU
MKTTTLRKLVLASLLVGFGHGFVGCSSDEGEPKTDDVVQATDQEESAEAGTSGEAPPVNEEASAGVEPVEAADCGASSAGEEAADCGGSTSSVEEIAPVPELEQSVEAPVPDGYDSEEKTESVSTDLTVEMIPQGPMAVPEMPTANEEVAIAPQGGMEGAQVISYVVKSGDTVSRIAKKIYGSETQWREIATASGLSNPDRIFPGNVLKVPVLNEQSKHFQSARVDGVKGQGHNTIVVVKPGDTLSSIAQAELGNAGHWSKIYKQNSGSIKDPDNLVVGQKLSLNKKSSH